MTDFVTVTLNPALDVSTAVDRVEDAHKLRCDSPQMHPGGGGINVARVLHRFGASVQALYTSGGPTGERLSQLVVAEGVPSLYVRIAGETRESFSVSERSTGHQFRFVLPGPTLAEAEWQGVIDRLGALPKAPSVIVASGGLAPGVPTDFHARLARQARERGSRFVLDSNGPALKAALDEGVWLVKPSQRELGELTGRSLDSLDDQLQAARELIQQGRSQVVALSLGADGALLVTAEGAWQASSLPATVHSTVGAGDSFLAAMLWSFEASGDWPLALRSAIAAGASALSAAGTALCQPADVMRWRDQVVLTPHGSFT